MSRLIIIDKPFTLPAATIAKLQQSYSGVINPGPPSLVLNIPSLGSADPTRRIFIVGVGVGMGTVTGISISGIPAAIHTTYSSNIRIASAPVPTGTSGSATFSFSGSAAKNFTAWVFRVTNLTSATPIDVAENFQTSAPGSWPLSLDTAEDGILIGGVFGTAASGFSVTGITNAEENFVSSVRHWGAWEETPTTNTPQIITVTQVGSGSSGVGTILAFR